MPSGGSLLLETGLRGPDFVEAVIADTGPGLGPGQAELVASGFRSGRAGGGSGLGLPIARRIFELHGGVFELRQREEKGAEAVVRLPVPPAAAG
jgi:signal transduction histidine kinase